MPKKAQELEELFSISYEGKEGEKAKNPEISGFLLSQIKESILGKKYNLSLVFTTSSKMKKLNEAFRGKDSSTDILSFPISKTEGEIFISMNESAKEAKKFGREKINFIYFLFIHGSTHLKGFSHGSKMESEEKKQRIKFGV
jgi:probable rRNA maturation factor